MGPVLSPRRPSGARVALGFLTRIPAGSPPVGPEDLARSVPWFAVVGAGVGLVSAGVYALASWVLPPLAAATLAVAGAVIVTGAFHEDGLADTADALGPHDPDRARAAMRDSRLGTFGTLALVLSVLVRVTCLAVLAPVVALGVLPAAGALGRAGAVGLMGPSRAAPGEGLGAGYLAAVRPRHVVVGVGVGVVLGAAGLWWWVVPAGALAAAGALAVAAWARRHLGGLTGDVLGAAEQLGELAVLLVAAAAVTGGWPSPPWW